MSQQVNTSALTLIQTNAKLLLHNQPQHETELLFKRLHYANNKQRIAKRLKAHRFKKTQNRSF